VGGQIGHEGHGRPLLPVEQVDAIVEIKPPVCAQCGSALTGDDRAPARHQVAELPRIVPEVTEYRRHTLTCGTCGTATAATWPQGMPRGGFGPRTQATVAYLAGRLGISQRDVGELLQTLFHLEVSLGSVAALERQGSAAVAAPVAEAQAFVQQQAVVNADETGWREGTQRMWLWTAVTPLVSVFLPDRLELIKGVPMLRRGHLDQFVAAMWPARIVTRRAYAQALAQRNALINRIRAGHGARASLLAWDHQLAHHGSGLMADRRQAVSALEAPFARLAETLGLEDGAQISYRPRSRAVDANCLAAELAERVDSDLERGFTGHGPHRDELTTMRAGRDLRVYGSQGQQRLALLALLLAERETLATTRASPPLMLLDDVMSELDGARRQSLAELLRGGGGQSVITTTDLDHVPGARGPGIARLSVATGRVLRDALAA